MVREKLETPSDLLLFKLGVALTMERTVHDMLWQIRDKARHPGLKRLLAERVDEADNHIVNLGRAFALLGADPDDKPCGAIKAAQSESRQMIERTRDELVDAVIAGSTGEIDHYGIAVYEELVILAEAIGRTDVAELLYENLDQEQRTLAEVRRSTRAIAHDTARRVT
jgi:ferritin-like metal-binding protein YciE